MTIEFTSDDLTKLDEIIQVTPFKYAMPIFQFFQAKIAEEQQKAAKQKEDTNIDKLKTAKQK